MLNEGGLFGERQGWHLPGFDTSHWAARDLSEGLPGGKAGVGFFVTTFELDFPREADVLMGFQFEAENTQSYRALLFVNGWMFGKVRRLFMFIRFRPDLVGKPNSCCLYVACGELGPAVEVPGSSGDPELQRKEVSAVDCGWSHPVRCSDLACVAPWLSRFGLSTTPPRRLP